MMEGDNRHLRRGLKNRHIQMIALGGAIGTGLFYGSAEAISLAGPATILSYLIGGLVIYLIMRMLGEMSTEEPVAGSFSFFAYKYWNGFAGFFAGWNYWFLYILVSMAELTVIGIYLDHWFAIDHWISSLVVLLAITAVNLINVRFYGEFEFWFAIIKVIAVIGMIVFGVILIITGLGGANVAVSNLWNQGGFFPLGVSGMIMAFVVIMFSFGGTELIGVAAGEAESPEKTIPKAINQVMWRILIFYIGAITVIMILNPWNLLNKANSPFVSIFTNIGIPAAGHILNFVVLTAAISVYNSGIYSNSRMLYSLAEQGNAPRFFKNLSHNRVPFIAIMFSSLCTAVAVIINYLVPNEAFMRVMAVATTAAAMTWATIILVHLRFRRAKNVENSKTKFPSPLFPLANYICLLFLLLLVSLMILTGFSENGLMTYLLKTLHIIDVSAPAFFTLAVPDMSLSVVVMPIWFLILYLGFKLKKAI
ncbi:amino acid permease [Bartonella sp. HY406]|uniref:amino acid permease n=1 Tax=Bartonella sp. HY406 TaxID=2979331 RepID=UPI003965C019